MIDKSLVKKRFSKSLDTYDENAIVQSKMAEKLIEVIPVKRFNSIFEAGCATGILTKEIKKNIRFNSFTANDIVEKSRNYIDKIIFPNNFITGDIEQITLIEKYDLIISNACLQWCNNIEDTIDKLINFLNKNGILAISIFGDNNLQEIKDIFGIENKSYKLQELKEFIKKYNAKIEEEVIELSFNEPIEILKHLKYTGVNAIKEFKLTKSKIAKFEQEYRNKYSKDSNVILTYNPVYIIITRQDDIE